MMKLDLNVWGNRINNRIKTKSETERESCPWEPFFFWGRVSVVGWFRIIAATAAVAWKNTKQFNHFVADWMALGGMSVFCAEKLSTHTP